MSLLRLLTAGKSLVGVRDAESRYRLSRERLLPQFGSPQNPFIVTGRSTWAEARPSANDGGNGIPARGSGGAATPRAKRALPLKTAVFLTWCKTRISGLLPRPRGKPVKPSIPRFVQQPVQGELSLDKVQVVRNDLRDADLEVVSAGGVAKQTTEKDPGTDITLGRVAARILGARKP
jgi:hypothetical protein